MSSFIKGEVNTRTNSSTANFGQFGGDLGMCNLTKEAEDEKYYFDAG